MLALNDKSRLGDGITGGINVVLEALISDGCVRDDGGPKSGVDSPLLSLS